MLKNDDRKRKIHRIPLCIFFCIFFLLFFVVYLVIEDKKSVRWSIYGQKHAISQRNFTNKNKLGKKLNKNKITIC